MEEEYDAREKTAAITRSKMNNLNQKEDISTWEKTGHLYLGLTLQKYFCAEH